MRGVLISGAGALCLCLGVSTPAEAKVTLADGHGRVEVVPDSGGRGVGILPGEALGAGTLKVGPSSKAVLKTDDGTTVELDGPGQARVATSQGTEVALNAGHVLASGGSHAVEVKTPTGLVASGTGAEFEVALAEDGAVRVASKQGTVSVALKGAKAEVAAGQALELGKDDALPASAKAVAAQAKPEPKAEQPKPEPKPVVAKAEPKPEPKPVVVAKADEPKPEPKAEEPKPEPKAEEAKPAAKADEPKAEAKPAPAPAGPPTLTVKWPANNVFTTFTLKGQVTPGSQVTVNSVAATVRKNGSFSAKVELPEGESTVEVKAVAADGQTATDQHPIKAITPPKPAEGDAAAQQDNGSKPKVKQEAAGWE